MHARVHAHVRVLIVFGYKRDFFNGCHIWR
jgi:hypothetical protein